MVASHRFIDSEYVRRVLLVTGTKRPFKVGPLTCYAGTMIADRDIKSVVKTLTAGAVGVAVLQVEKEQLDEQIAQLTARRAEVVRQIDGRTAVLHQALRQWLELFR